MTRRVRVANASLKAVAFSASCERPVRVAGKGVAGTVANDDWRVTSERGRSGSSDELQNFGAKRRHPPPGFL